MTSTPASRRLPLLFTLLAAYWCLVRFGFDFSGLHPGRLALLWLPSGIALVLAFTYTSRILPLLWILGIAAYAPSLQRLAADHPGSLYLPALICVAAGDALQALLGRWLWRRQLAGGIRFSRDVGRFLVFICLMPGFSAALFVGLSLHLTGMLIADETAGVILAAGMAQTLGLFLVTPLHPAFTRTSPAIPNHAGWGLGCAAAISLIIVLSTQDHFYLIYSLLPAFLLLAIKTNFPTFSTVLLFTSIALTFLASRGQGPFAHMALSHHAPLETLSFVFSLGFSKLIAAALRAEIHLHDVNLKTRLSDQASELKKLTMAVEQSPSAIAITDTAGKIQYVNPAFEAQTGYTAEFVLGKNPRILKSGFQGRAFYDDLWHTISAGRRWRGEFLNRRRNRTHYWASTSIAPIRDEEDRIVGYISVAEDVSDKKRLEEELKAAKEIAEEANRAKSRFLATMSHELRTPLNSVIGFSNVLLKNRRNHLDMTECDYIRRILNNGSHLLELINSILDLAKIEANRMEVNWEEIEVDELVQETVAQLQGQATGKPIVLKSECPPGPLRLRTDSRKLRQILINLAGNAIKFTQEGSVVVRVVADDERRRPTRIEVEDTGPGIPARQLNKIFEAFTQVSGGTDRLHEGSGLGLSISHALARLINCRIVVSSVEGKGSIFSVILPGPESEKAEQEG